MVSDLFTLKFCISKPNNQKSHLAVTWIVVLSSRQFVSWAARWRRCTNCRFVPHQTVPWTTCCREWSPARSVGRNRRKRMRSEYIPSLLELSPRSLNRMSNFRRPNTWFPNCRWCTYSWCNGPWGTYNETWRVALGDLLMYRHKL